MDELKVAWGITGGGQHLKETLDVFRKIKGELDPKITTYVSAAGEEVARLYGVFDLLGHVSPGGHYEEIFTQSGQGASCMKAGRFYTREYAALFIAPATTNSVAKIARGIADTLVTNAATFALKYKTPLYILPTDGPDLKEIKIPDFLNREGKEVDVAIEPRKVDMENLARLEKEGATVLEDAGEIYDICRGL